MIRTVSSTPRVKSIHNSGCMFSTLNECGFLRIISATDWKGRGINMMAKERKESRASWLNTDECISEVRNVRAKRMSNKAVL